jgi:hypothetical protein
MDDEEISSIIGRCEAETEAAAGQGVGEDVA